MGEIVKLEKRVRIRVYFSFLVAQIVKDWVLKNFVLEVKKKFFFPKCRKVFLVVFSSTKESQYVGHCLIVSFKKGGSPRALYKIVIRNRGTTVGSLLAC
jgi:hypothetical protein